MSQSRLSDVLPQKKRIAHQVPISTKPSTSKADAESQRKAEFDILKKFDLTLEYGPCLGITRMERWERAQKHGLNPPLAVKDLILLNQRDESYVQSLWYDYNTLK